MKKILLTLFITLGLISTTGCTKHSYTMSIDKNDKLIIAETQLFNKDVLDRFGKDYNAEIDSKISEYNNSKSFKEKGYKAEKISDGNYVGIKVKKKFNSLRRINTVQIPKEISYSRVLKSKGTHIVEIKNGLFRRNYSLNFTFNTEAVTSSVSALQTKYVSDIKKDIKKAQKTKNTDLFMLSGKSAPEELLEDEDVITSEEELDESNFNEEVKTSDDIETVNDLKTLLKSIEDDETLERALTFSVRLPVEAKEHNATNVVDGYIYEWDLSNGGNTEILLKWEKVHITNIIVFGFFGLILLIIYGLLHSKRHIQLQQEQEKKIQKIAASTITLRGIHKGAKGYKKKK